MTPRAALFRNLLLSICILLVSYPTLINEGLFGKCIEAVYGLGILITGLRATLGTSRPPRWTGVTLLLLIAVWIGEVLLEGPSYLDIVRLSLVQIFFLRFIWRVGRDVFVTQRVSASGRLLGAICVYLLIAVSFADLYLIFDRLWPDSFTCSQTLCPSPEGSKFHAGLHIYFSLVVLTTMGFGDITPGTPSVAMLVGLEAVIGQMFVAIVISRLVAIHLQESTKPQ